MFASRARPESSTIAAASGIPADMLLASHPIQRPSEPRKKRRVTNGLAQPGPAKPSGRDPTSAQPQAPPRPRAQPGRAWPRPGRVAPSHPSLPCHAMPSPGRPSKRRGPPCGPGRKASRVARPGCEEGSNREAKEQAGKQARRQEGKVSRQADKQAGIETSRQAGVRCQVCREEAGRSWRKPEEAGGS